MINASIFEKYDSTNLFSLFHVTWWRYERSQTFSRG